MIDWPGVLERLKTRTSKNVFDTWLAPTTAERRNGELIIYVASARALEIFEHQIRPLLDQVLPGESFRFEIAPAKSPQRDFHPLEDISKNYTQIHNYLLDEIMPGLSLSAWKILCLIMRETYGWQRESQAISFRRIMAGTGLVSFETVQTALTELVQNDLIIIQRYDNKFRSNEYKLNTEYTPK